MTESRFVCNDALWAEIGRRVARAKRAQVAVAYLGQGGAGLLPLPAGSRLVVDMSLPAVKAHETDPREIKKLIEKGVNVFSRRGLHAKVFVFDRGAVVGSANVSDNSRRCLEEAAILTNDSAAVRRALQLIDGLCVEPVRPEYLKHCIAAYKASPVRGRGRGTGRRVRSRRAPEASVWFMGGLRLTEPRASETEAIRAIQERVARKLAHPSQTEVSWIQYGRRRVPKHVAGLRAGDWVVTCSLDPDESRRYVGPPGQFLGLENGVAEDGNRFVLVTTESPKSGEAMTLSEFRRRVRRLIPELDRESPRTRPIPDSAQADAVLRLWTHTGKMARRRR